MASRVENPSTFLRRLFDRAVEVADPMQSLASHLPPRPAGRVVVVGAGKASARMAEAVEAAWGPCEGIVITRYGHARPSMRVEIVEAAHPVPDAAGLNATRRMLDLLATLREGDFVLVLMSGGASALLIQPAEEITLTELQSVTSALLASGAPIDAINLVRKHLSLVKGGQLAVAAWPARVLCLMISDVPGDDPGDIGSGPTVGDASLPADARAVLDAWHIDVPASVDRHLSLAARVIRPDDPRLSRTQNRIYAAPAQSIAAAAALATSCDVRSLGDAIEGEARVVARTQARMAMETRATLSLGSRPVLLLSGGELTVTRRGDGIGGPNAEFCLAMAIALQGAPGIHAIACDTDGIDGAAEVAGARIDPTTLARAATLGLDPATTLDRNDAHGFFNALGDGIVTGPTLTNVNDFRAILIHNP